jgi:hypothetical protein
MNDARLIEGIKVLMNGYWDLPSSIPETEVEAEASRVLKRLKTHDNLENIEFFLSQIQSNRFGLDYTKQPTRELAEKAFKLIGPYLT